MAAPTIVSESSEANVLKGIVNIKALLNPNGKATNLVFEWGLTTGYGNTTSPAIPCGSGTLNVEQGHQLNPANPGETLLPGTTYHFRASATNSEGTTKGTDATFTTLPLAILVVEALTELAPTSVKTNFSINPEGEAGEAWIEYGPTNSYGSRTASVPITFATGYKFLNSVLSGLFPYTTYHYRLAYKGESEPIVQYSADHVFTTEPVPHESNINIQVPQIGVVT